MNDESTQRYQTRMQKKKAVVDARIAQANESRGVLILLKGAGKGKSSSAFGTLARTLGHGYQAAVVQFIKGRRETGEYLFFRDHPALEWHIMGHGFTWETQDQAQDKAAAEAAWEVTERLLQDERYRLLILDEMSYMLKYGHLSVERVVQALQQRPKTQNVMITGRTMAQPLQAIADTISDVGDERHAFRGGVKAQAGIEY